HVAHLLLVNNFKVASHRLGTVALVDHVEVGSIRQVVTQHGDTAIRPAIEVHVYVVIPFRLVHQCTGTVEDPDDVVREVGDTVDVEQVVHTVIVPGDTVEWPYLSLDLNLFRCRTTQRSRHRDGVNARRDVGQVWSVNSEAVVSPFNHGDLHVVGREYTQVTVFAVAACGLDSKVEVRVFELLNDVYRNRRGNAARCLARSRNRVSTYRQVGEVFTGMVRRNLDRRSDVPVEDVVGRIAVYQCGKGAIGFHTSRYVRKALYVYIRHHLE